MLRLATTLGLAAAVAACAHGHSILPHISGFGGGKAKPKYTGSGERISLLAPGDVLTVSDALKGQDFALPDPQPIAAWPLPGGTPENSVEHVAAGRDFQIAWRRKFGRGETRAFHVTASPVAADGRIYVMDGEATVEAIDAASGRDIWRTDLAIRGRRDREAYGGGLAYADGRLYVTSGYRFVAAVDGASGKLIWRTRTDAPVHAAPTIVDGRVIAESTDDNLMSFDAQTGAAGWTHQALTENARILAATSPAVSGDTVVATFASGEVAALQAGTGNELWTVELSRTNRNSALSEIRDIPGRPVIYRGDVYAVSHSGLMSVIDLRTGNTRWQLPVTGISTPWPAGDVVFVTDISGRVVCAARDSGQIYWITDLNYGKRQKFRAIWSGPVLAAGHLVLVSDKGEAVELNPKTGGIERQMKLGADALLNPIAAGPYLYVATDAADLIAIR
ncbi:MAG TPA: PQQ-binding-like beta-propeller repeat protein [Caulobacteraceae bacterium]|nr:PQQ-binding-like beta-propeller repeat protein [Caulobacteraceae bacterium]